VAPPDTNKTFAALRADLDRERINLIDADLDTGMTFLRIADTELGLGNLERTQTLIAKARTAYDAIGKLLIPVTESEEQSRLRDRHQALDAAIQEMERRKRRYEKET
jgi:hypothetical protein